jgi:hypothetical protein
MPPVAFEPTIPASEQPQIHALDRAANGIGLIAIYKPYDPGTCITPKTHLV